jgi:uncharacterized protein (TIGR02147 family)
MVRSDTPNACPIEVFEYLDIRAFLAAYYEARKQESAAFSYRFFARKVGMRSPNHLKRVIDGERPLTAPMAVRYADAIGLRGDAHAYFLDLAAFSRVSSNAERNVAYARLTSYRRTREAHRLEHAQGRYHATWYVPAVRELVGTVGFREDPLWVARSLVPPISRSEAANALALLVELGLVRRDADGRLVQSEAVLTTGPETGGLHIANYHRSMMRQAAESIDLVQRSQRDISSLTFGANDAVLAEVKARLVAFRREIIALVAECQDPTRVVQLNFQLFPLSRVPEETP